APAPTRSSNDGRSMPEARHCSPLAMTAIGVPCASAACATAVALRRQPASTVAPDLAAVKVTRAPLGEATTNRVPCGARDSDRGECGYGCLAPASLSPSAATPPIRAPSSSTDPATTE